MEFSAVVIGLLACGVTWIVTRLALQGKLASQGVLAEQSAKQVEQLRAECAELQAKYTQALVSLSSRDTEFKVIQEQLQAERTHVQNLKEEIKVSFSALSADALKSSTEQFLKSAELSFQKFEERARGAFEQKTESFNELVKPVRETLVKFDETLANLEVKRASAYERVVTQIEELKVLQTTLHKETATLARALSAPKSRGRWGELQLRRVVELAGMVEHCDFEEQASFQKGALRPDLVIKIPGGKQLAVDAKTPIDDYLLAVEATSDELRQQHLRAYAQRVKTHIAELSKKEYWQALPGATEFVVMFLPGEIFFAAALEADPRLIETGIENRVIVATPTTLIALLKAVSFGWRQEKMAENSQKIADLGRELYTRLSKVADHLRALGDGLQTTVRRYNEAVSSFDSRVLVSARKFSELGATETTADIEAPQPLEVLPREVAGPR